MHPICFAAHRGTQTRETAFKDFCGAPCVTPFRDNVTTIVINAVVIIVNCVKRVCLRVVSGDLNASEITMSEDDRIDLMIKVKEGKLSMHDAVEMVCIK